MALKEDIQALQKQLEETELDCVYTKAQIATLARLTDSNPLAAVSAPAAPAKLSERRLDAPSQQQSTPQQAGAAVYSEVRAVCPQQHALLPTFHD